LEEGCPPKKVTATLSTLFQALYFPKAIDLLAFNIFQSPVARFLAFACLQSDGTTLVRILNILPIAVKLQFSMRLHAFGNWFKTYLSEDHRIKQERKAFRCC
jgi:hypothetical protein